MTKNWTFKNEERKKNVFLAPVLILNVERGPAHARRVAADVTESGRKLSEAVNYKTDQPAITAERPEWPGMAWNCGCSAVVIRV